MAKKFVMIAIGEDGKVVRARAVDTNTPRIRIRESIRLPCYIEVGTDDREFDPLPISVGERKLTNAVFAAFVAVVEVGLTPAQRRRIQELAPHLKLNE